NVPGVTYLQDIHRHRLVFRRKRRIPPLSQAIAAPQTILLMTWRSDTRAEPPRTPRFSFTLRSLSNHPRPLFVLHRTIIAGIYLGSVAPRTTHKHGEMTMGRYAIDKTTVNEAVSGGKLLVVARWEAKDGQADKVADILSRFLPEAQREPGAKLFLISR